MTGTFSIIYLPSPSKAVQTLINTINTVSAHIINFLNKLLSPKFIANIKIKYIYNNKIRTCRIKFSQRHRVNTNTYLSCCAARASIFKSLYLLKLNF